MTQPFAHYRAAHVLPAEDYDRVSAAFANAMAEARRRKPEGVGRNRNYDADIIGVRGALADQFNPFFTIDWIKGLEQMTGFSSCLHVDGALHSSAPGSRTGWIHTDFCSAWFTRSSAQLDGGPIFPDRAACDYFTGARRIATAAPTEYVRTGTLLYYLNNNEWKTGDGGETALYSSGIESENCRRDFVEPQNNTLVFFPCSPHSYHRFIANPTRERNSIVMWTHAPADALLDRWGDAFRRRGPT